MTSAFLGVLLLLQVPTPLSAFDRAKAESLIINRLPCLGCHELGGAGGRIGPSLSDVRQRRTPAYVYGIVKDPQGTVPGTIMPRVPMSEATRRLITSYLVQREPSRPAPASRPESRASPASPGARDPTLDTSLVASAALYARFCAPCHGVRGLGDGYNAANLPVRPTAHADSTYMATRSDDALFDAIAAGGYVMNRSNRMPSFGQTLTGDEIRGLVRYLRRLCRCEGPAWSRDNE